MGYLNLPDAVKQFTQRGQGEQTRQLALELSRLDFVPVMPVQRGANVEVPAQPVCRDLPVMRQIAPRLAAGVVEARQTGKDLPDQMLLGTSG